MCNQKTDLTVTLSKVEHRGKTRLKIVFPYNAEAVERVKQLNDRTWSETMKAWHLPFNKTSIEGLQKIFQHVMFADEESKVMFASQNALYGDEVMIWKSEGYIYLKVKASDLREKSLLSNLEMSRNYHSSGYWKIKKTEANNTALAKRFGSRLRQWPSLPNEIEQYDNAQRRRNKVTVVITGKRVRVIVEKNEDIIGFIKTMPFYKWDPINKWWSFAYSEKNIQLFTTFCSEKKLDLLIDNLPVFKQVQKRRYDINSPGYRKCPEEMLEKLRNRRYSEHTIKQYCSIFEEFINYHRKVALEDLGPSEIREYIAYLVQERKVSASYQNVAVNAIKFYYEKVLGGPRRFIEIDRPRREMKLPNVLAVQEVKAMIAVTKNFKHKFIIIMLYSTGLRLNELLQLKCSDIDRINMRIFVKRGKGKKDRYVQLAYKTLASLDEYLALYNPREYLFEGSHEQYSASSVAQIVSNAAIKSGISMHVTPHMLRHSYATHLLEQGVDMRYIQELLGHENVRTTEIYTHISQRGLKNIINPFDKMDF